MGVGIAIAAGLLYVFLRLLAWSPGNGDPRHSARSHALWTAAIAFFASTTSGLRELTIVAAPTLVTDDGGSRLTIDAGADMTTAGIALAAASPGLWLGLIYVIAQFTWPRPNSRVRTASLVVRRLRDYLPRALAAAFAGISVLALATIAWAWTSPGAAPVTGRDTTVYEPSGDVAGTDASPAIDGLRAGVEYAPWLLAGLLLAIAATCVAALVIVRRRPLAGLGDADNQTMRRIALNRLLRTAILVAGGFLLAAAGGAIAVVQFASVAPEERGYSSGFAIGPATSNGELPWAWLVAVLAVGQFVVLVAMVAARPPRLSAERDPSGLPGSASLPGSFAAGRLLLNRCHAWAMLFLVPLPVALIPMPEFEGNVPRMPAPPLDGIEWQLAAVGLPFALYFLCMLGAEALLRRGHSPRKGQRTPPDGPRPLVPATALAAGAALYILAGILSLLTPHGDRPLVLSLTLGLVAAALPAAAWWLLARRRPDLGRATGAEDARLRALSRHRILRLSAAALLVGTSQLVLLDSAAWFHWSGGGMRYAGEDDWTMARITIGLGLLVVAVAVAFWPSQEFARAAEPAEPRSARVPS